MFGTSSGPLKCECVYVSARRNNNEQKIYYYCYKHQRANCFCLGKHEAIVCAIPIIIYYSQHPPLKYCCLIIIIIILIINETWKNLFHVNKVFFFTFENVSWMYVKVEKGEMSFFLNIGHLFEIAKKRKKLLYIYTIHKRRQIALRYRLRRVFRDI